MTKQWRTAALMGLLVLAIVGCGDGDSKPGNDGNLLTPQLHLHGSFVLSYNVISAAGGDIDRAIEEAVTVLKRRLDPDGDRGISVTRREETVLDIRAPLPPAAAWKLRTDYLNLLDRLTSGQVTASELKDALVMPEPQRAAALAALAKGDELRTLTSLVPLFDRLMAAHAAFAEAHALTIRAEHAEESLTGDASEDEKLRLKQAAKDASAVRTRRVAQFVDARRAYNAALDAILAKTPHRSAVERVLESPALTAKTRRDAMENLIRRHPSRADEIKAVVAAYGAYERARGAFLDPDDLIAMVRGLGELEFRIAPEPSTDLRQYVEAFSKDGPDVGRDADFIWCEIGDVSTFAESAAEEARLESDPARFFTSRGLVGDAHQGSYYLLLSNRRGERLSSAEPGWRLETAERGLDADGLNAITFRLNEQGGKLLGTITQNNRGRQLAVTLDDQVMMTGTVESRIETQGQISRPGGYTARKLDHVLRVLNAGRLKVTLPVKPSAIQVFPAQ